MSTAETRAETRTDTRTDTRGPLLDDAFDLELEQMALAVSEEPPPLEEPREPGLARYLKYQAKDFVKHRGAAIFAISMIALWIFNYNYEPELLQRAAREGRPIDPASERVLFDSIVTGLSLLFGGLGSLLSAAGIVSRDREGGHQKFLFAKPVRITRFYLQAFAVNGVGLLLTGLVVLLMTSLVFLRPVPLVEPLLAMGAMYAAVGGLTFLISTLVRFDLALALALSVVAIPLHQATLQGRWWAVATSWLLPPTYTLDAFKPFDEGRGFARYSVWQSVGSLVAYGAAYMAIGVAVLKRRSIIR
jgi:ABC-type transport system involved in multi-copper enzyme maturation permease subunit